MVNRFILFKKNILDLKLGLMVSIWKTIDGILKPEQLIANLNEQKVSKKILKYQ